MELGMWSKRAVTAAALTMLIGGATRAADTGGTASTSDVSAELNALKARIADLESQQHDNWLTKERESQIRGIVEDVLKDAKSRGQFADGVETGYSPGNGFYIQTPDKNFKLQIGGFAQVRYEYTQSNAYNNRSLGTRTVGGGTGAGTTALTTHPGNDSGIDIRRARISFAGNAFTPDLTFKFEGDFYGGGYVNSIAVANQNNAATGPLPVPAQSSGAFTVTDAFIAYRLTDQVRFKIGSYKVPFAKDELTSDTNGEFMERPEAAAPFDPVRALGFSVYGDIIKDKLSYEVAINDGGSTFFGTSANLYRRPDTVSGSPPVFNIDNRPSFYARVQWAGNGKISDFAEEADMRADNRDFVWMLGGAAGYESQNATNNAFPSGQSSTGVGGLSNGTNGGFAGVYNLNGDLYRGTVDWSAKYQGLSINTAGYIQQINANPGNTSTTSATTITTGPFGTTKASFFEYGAYGQVGYFVMPLTNGKGLELVGRAGVIGTEGYHDMGEFYSVGANYYLYGNNFKIASDVTFTPEAAYTDAAAALLQNTHDITFRVQVQLRF